MGLAAGAWRVVLLARSRQTRLLPLLGAGFATIAVLVPLALLGWAMHALLGALGATPAPWTAQAASLVATFVLLAVTVFAGLARRSEEHTSELQSLMRISYAVFCLKKKKLAK